MNNTSLAACYIGVVDGRPIGALEPWRVQLMGAFKVERKGKAAVFRTKKTASLLAYLAYYRGSPISKELLVEALWPESDTEKGRHSLRMAVSSIRSALQAADWDPNEHIISTRDALELSESGFSSDVLEFRNHLRAAEAAPTPALEAVELANAVDIYAGSFLPGYGDEWILPQALELEEAYAQAACRLIKIGGEAKDLQAAALVGRKAIALCPSREDLHIALMQAYAANGQRAAALKQYEELERMLDETWGEMPSDEAQATLEALPKSTEAALAAIDQPRPASEKTRTASDQASFFGREQEIQQLTRLLQPGPESSRLVSLIGLGGTGKTRLAQKITDVLVEPFKERIWFLSLVGIEEAAQLHETLLTSLVESPPKNVDPLTAVAGAIGEAPSLLVLDNLEQIVAPSREAIEHLLEACPALHVLATSRVPLEAAGERLMPLAPLPLPSDYRDLAALRASPSVQLLVEAAQGVRPGFSVTPANAQSVLLLCQRLEGIPLAIELAAAKLAVLTPAQVIASIGRRVDLSSARTGIPVRHRSLETVIQWSLELLNESERAAFACLSVCRGGLNIQLGMDLIGNRAEEHLQRLCRCSLLGWSETNDEVRFEMLETVREMAGQLLESDPVLHQQAIGRHFAYVRNLCSGFEELGEEDRSKWVATLVAESGNLLAALEAATYRLVDAEEAWELALQLRHFIQRRGRSHVWVGPLDSLLRATLDDIHPATAAKAHALLADAYYGLRAIRSTYDHSLSAIEAADRAGDLSLRIDSRVELVTPAITLGEFGQAQQVLEEAVELLADTKDLRASARCYLNLAWVLFDSGREEESEPVFRQAYELAERSGHESTLGSALTGLACAIGHTRYKESQPIFDRAVAIWTTAGLPGLLAHCLYNRTMIDYRHGALDQAVANLAKAYRTYVANDIALGQTILSISGNLMSALGRYPEAAICWSRGDAARRRYGMTMIPSVLRDYEREIGKARAGMSPADFEAAYESGATLSDADLADRLFASKATLM